MNQNNSREELAKELRMVANMINMGEKIQWARETTLMDKAADMLETYHQELQKALAVQAIQIREEEANEYNKIIEREIQKAREEERKRISQLWFKGVDEAEIRYGFIRPIEFRIKLEALTQSELDQPNK
jgi:polyribonucleotide nucleotidyltransferase